MKSKVDIHMHYLQQLEGNCNNKNNKISLPLDKTNSIRSRRKKFLHLSFQKIKADPVFFKNNQDELLKRILITLKKIN